MSRAILYLIILAMPVMAHAQDEEEVIVDTAVAAPVEETRIGEYDEEEDKQKEIIPAQPEVRKVPDSDVDKLKKDKSFAYANDSAYWAKDKYEEKQDASPRKGFWDNFNDFFSGSGVRTVTYIILGVILVLLIYRIAVVNNLFMTAASRKRKETEEEGPLTEIDDNDLDAKARLAIQAGDYRSAIRFMYLKTLRSLNDKGWIRYHAQGTNYEYINQVHPHGVGNEFRFLTHAYEYVWYGEFALTEEQFNRLHQNFQHFFNAAKL